MRFTHLGDPFLAPLTDSFGDTNDTLYSLVKSLLDLLQSWNHGDIRDGQSHVDSEYCLLTKSFATAE